MSATTDAGGTMYEALLAMKRALDDGLDCEFHVKVSGVKSLAKMTEEFKTERDVLVTRLESAGRVIQELQTELAETQALELNHNGACVRLKSERDEARALVLESYIAGLSAYAWWKDGVEYVGTCGTRLKDAIELVRSSHCRRYDLTGATSDNKG
jgi:hypothetical protein